MPRMCLRESYSSLQTISTEYHQTNINSRRFSLSSNFMTLIYLLFALSLTEPNWTIDATSGCVQCDKWVNVLSKFQPVRNQKTIISHARLSNVSNCAVGWRWNCQPSLSLRTTIDCLGLLVHYRLLMNLKERQHKSFIMKTGCWHSFARWKSERLDSVVVDNTCCTAVEW